MSNKNVVEFVVNGQPQVSDVAADTPLIYVLRNDLKLTGTRFGCGAGHCGACTVIVDGVAIQSCNTPLNAVAGKHVRTVESLLPDASHPVLQKLFEEKAWQCGYCIAGIVMQAVAALERHRCGDSIINSVDELCQLLNDNLCRCGAHHRIILALAPLFDLSVKTTQSQSAESLSKRQ